MLKKTKKELIQRISELNECIAFINNKQKFYDDVLEGKIQYSSNTNVVTFTR